MTAVPIGLPGLNQLARRIHLEEFALHAKWLAIVTESASSPPTADAKVRTPFPCLVGVGRSPPSRDLVWIRQRSKNPICGGSDFDVG